jgi:ferric-dicitrate binding protein FerR (iron transport regulator)
MSPLHCAEVEGRLDLYAAGECDAAEAGAIGRHLAACPRCATAYREARDLLALLDLRWQEPERLRRLAERLAAEEEPRRLVRRFPPGVRRFAALAALLLLAVGPLCWLSPPVATVADGGLAIALQQEDVRGLPAAQMKAGNEGAREGPKTAPAGVQGDLRFAMAGDHRSPPEVDLALELRNTTDSEMRVEVAGPRTELRLALQGPGVKVTQAHEEPSQAAKAETVTLKPGQSHTLRITRLEDGPPGARRQLYWTEPGDYTLTARITTVTSSPGLGERRITARSAPVTIHVGGPPP